MTAVEYRAVFEASPDGILVVDEQGRIRDLNPQAEELFGYGRAELVGEPVETLVPEGARSVHTREREAYVRNPEPRPMGIGMELTGLRKDGREFPVEISLSPLRRGEDDGLLVIATVRDVSQRKRLRAFGAGALHAAEEERRRIARELHDDVAQRVATLIIRLRLAQREAVSEEREAMFEGIREELLECSEAIRRLARGLRPPALEDAGIATAIRAHVRERLGHEEIEVSLDAEPVDGALDDDVKLALYRIVQESLSNVVRHAGAGRVRISVRRADGEILAEVEDDGSGFSFAGEVDGSGERLGLLGMQERANIIGGRLEISTEPGSGTLVRVRVPVGTRDER